MGENGISYKAYESLGFGGLGPPVRNSGKLSILCPRLPKQRRKFCFKLLQEITRGSLELDVPVVRSIHVLFELTMWFAFEIAEDVVNTNHVTAHLVCYYRDRVINRYALRLTYYSSLMSMIIFNNSVIVSFGFSIYQNFHTIIGTN